jgi:hypothetical protein
MAHFIDFKVGGFKVGRIQSTSGVFVGQNLQYGWRTSSKQNQASRNVTGDYNYSEDALNQIDDPDMLDTWVQKPLPFTNVNPPSPALMTLYGNRKRKYRRSRREKDDF